MAAANRFYVNVCCVVVEGLRVHTYGITAEGPEGTEAVEDISASEAAVQALCHRLRREDVSPLHLRDIVVDLLASEDGIG